MSVGECFTCGDAGHQARACPLLRPAASREEHAGRIASIVRRWHDGQISLDAKRRLITAENLLWSSLAKPLHPATPDS